MGMMERFASLAAGGPVTDPQFNAVTMLLRSNQTNGSQNNTFLDSSTNNFSITRNGNTTQGAFSPFSQTGWSNYFSGGYFTAPANAAFSFAGDFTVECWINPPSLSTSNSLWIMDVGGSSYLALNVGQTATDVYLNSLGVVFTATHSAITYNAWTHIALVRSGSTVRVYVNGTQASGTGTNSSTLGSSGATFRIGGFTGGFTGYVSNFRVVKSAVYTNNFTPSTTPLTVIANTSLLTLQDNRLVDNSTNNFAITVAAGTPSIQPFSPFAPTAAYNPATHGGSGHFDGTGDYLTTPDSTAYTMGSGDFTIEFWGYVPAYSDMRAYGQVNSVPDGNTISFFGGINGSNKAYSGVRSGVTEYACISTNNWPLGQWVHHVLTRNGTTLRQYINGVQDGTVAVGTTSINDSANLLAIGRVGEYNALHWNGYISSLRITKGGCLYPNGTTFTPPTAPFTTTVSSGTVSLLTNFTNAGIRDAAGRHMIETSAGAIVANGTYQPTATGSAGANTITVSSATNLKRGQSVSGDGIASGAYVTAISGTTITLSANNTGAVSGAMTFVDPTKWGNGSFYFPGTGNSALLVRDTQLMKVGAQAFTYETWTFAIANQVMMFQFQSNSTGFSAIRLQPTGTNQYTLYMSANGSTWPVQTQSTGTFPLNQWVHVAVNRDGSNITVFVNGDVFISASVSITTMSDVNNVIGNIWSGGALSGSSSFLGYMEDFRTTLGAARYAVGTGANANKMVFKGTNILALPQSQFPVQ